MSVQINNLALALDINTGGLASETPAPITRGFLHHTELQLLAGGAPQLLPISSTIILEFFKPGSDTVLASVTSWTRNAPDLTYAAMIDTVAPVLGGIRYPVLEGRLRWTPAGDSEVVGSRFHIRFAVQVLADRRDQNRNGIQDLAETCLFLMWERLRNVPSSFPPSAHNSSHEAGGEDALILDEDDLASNSDKKAPTQRSVASFVAAKLADLVDGAPEVLDTLNELAAALGNDANYASTITQALAAKAAKDASNLDVSAVTAWLVKLGLSPADAVDLAALTIGGDPVDSRSPSDARYLRQALNLADLPDPASARVALGNVPTRGEVDALAAKPFPPALYIDGTAGSSATLPLTSADLAGQSWTMAWCGRFPVIPSGPGYARNIFGNIKGISYNIEGALGLGAGVRGDRGKLVLTTEDGIADYSEIKTADILTAGKRYTFAATYDNNTGTASLYVDGSLVDSADWSSVLNLTSTQPLRLSVSGDADATYGIETFTEYALIENRALPDAEIAARYGLNPTAPVTSPAAGLGRTDDLMATFTDWDDTGYAFDSFAQSGMNGFTASSSGSARCWATTGQSVEAGYAVRVAFDVVTTISTIDSTVLSSPGGAVSSAAVQNLAIVDAPAGCTLLSSGIRMPAGTNGRIVLEMTLSESLANLSYRFAVGGVSTITVDNFTITSPGLLVHYSASQSTRAGDQLHDLSGMANDALITDGTFTEPTASDFYRARAVDASSALYLGRAGDILPANAVVTSVIVEGTVYPITNTQPTDRRRIRLVPNGADLDVQRSDGTSHTTLVSAAPVADLSAVNLIINYQRY